MYVREILQAIKDASEDDETSIILSSDNDQKLIIPVHKKDKRCIEIVEYLAALGDEDYEIRDILVILQDAYWWLQTLAILYNADDGDATK